MYKLYLKQVILFFLLFCIPLGGNWLFLLNLGELLPVNDVVKYQLSSKNNCIVGLATRNQGYYYKKAMYKELLPNILILGSSRVMQFRKNFFKDSMMTSGGAMSSINEGFSYIKDIFDIHVPEVVIIGLDYWWFNENAVLPSSEIKPPLELASRISLRKYILPLTWVWHGKISKNSFLHNMNPINILKSGFDNGVGVDGILNKNGFGSDGSYYYTKLIIGKEKSYDEHFQVSLKNIETNGARFEYADRVNTQHFKNFMALVTYIKSYGSRIIVFIPPLAPTVVSRMNDFSEQYSFIDELRHNLSANGIEYFDFHDPGLLDTSDCEFIDGIHGGDVVYARILKYISERTSDFGYRVNTDYLDKIIFHYHNLAMIPQSEITTQSELDFLKLGCKKHS